VAWRATDRRLQAVSGENDGQRHFAYARSEDRAAAFKAGFDVHLAQPLEPPELRIVLARLVNRPGRDEAVS